MRADVGGCAVEVSYLNIFDNSLQNMQKTSLLTPAALVMADQPFVVGPGISPVPAKLVSQIVVSKYIDLGDLLPVNL